MSNGKLRAGQEYLRRQGITAPFTEQVVEYSNPADPAAEKLTGREGVLGVEVIPKDEGSATVRTYDVGAILSALEGLVYQWDSRISLNLPEVLKSAAVVWNTNTGDGTTIHSAANQGGAFIGSGEAHVTPRATAQASASIMPDVQADIISYRDTARSVPATNLIFYALSPLSINDILTKLETVLGIVSIFDMPVFKPVSHVITCQGQQVSVQASADSSAVVAASGSSESYSYEKGSGKSKDVGTSTKTVVFPPTLHGNVSYGGGTQTQDATVTVKANTVDLYIGVTIVVPAITNEPTPTTVTATGKVSPSSLAATTPTDIPKSGWYIGDTNTNLSEFGLLMVHAAVVDMSIFA